MGLRYPRAFSEQLLKGVRAMKESVTYQAIIEEGEAIGEVRAARAILLRLGSRRFGPPDARTRTAIDAITSAERLEQLTERILDVENWDELLQS
jgi:hypothetical protein